MAETFRAGDVVKHIPTGETWTVAYHDGDWLAWYGWPEGETRAANCELVRAATDAQHRAALEEWAREHRTDSGRLDRRCVVARRQLFLLNEGYVGEGI